MDIVIGIIILVAAFVLSLVVMQFRLKRACQQVLKDLQEGEAFDTSTAVELPYSKTSFFNIGLRDFKPQALQQLCQLGIVGITDTGCYYLKHGWKQSAKNLLPSSHRT